MGIDIEIRPVYRRIDLRDYFGEGEAGDFDVWVNPPSRLTERWFELQGKRKEVLDELDRLAKKETKKPGSVSDEDREAMRKTLPELNDGFYEWLSQMWRFAGKEPTRSEIREFAERCEKDDLTFYLWLIDETWRLLNEHRDLSKKGSKMASSNSH